MGMVQCTPFVRWGWHKGLAVEVDQSMRKIKMTSDGSFQLVSLTENSVDCTMAQKAHSSVLVY